MTDSNGYSEDALLSIGAVAQRLGVSVATVRRWANDGRLEAVRTLGNQRRFRESDVEAIRAGSAA